MIHLSIVAPKRETVEEDNLAALIGACLNATDLVVLQLMASTGLRVSEVCQLVLADFDLDKGVLNVRVSKWGRSRKVGLTPNMLEGIQGFMQAQGPKQPSDVMFTNSHGAPFNRHSLNKRLVRMGQRAGVKLHAHMLRRLFITSNANKGRPLQMIQMAAGHSSIVTTRNYMMTKEQEVIEAMQSWC
mgnify:FL=1